MIFKTEPIRVLEADGTHVEQGEVGYCPDCGGREWYLFLIGITYTPHLQCCQCGAVFHCPGGATTDPTDLPQRTVGEMESLE